MTKVDFQTVDEYIAAQPKPVEEALRVARDAIRKAVLASSAAPAVACARLGTSPDLDQLP